PMSPVARPARGDRRAISTSHSRWVKQCDGDAIDPQPHARGGAAPSGGKVRAGGGDLPSSAVATAAECRCAASPGSIGASDRKSHGGGGADRPRDCDPAGRRILPQCGRGAAGTGATRQSGGVSPIGATDGPEVARGAQ